jgi:hypothetical protein
VPVSFGVFEGSVFRLCGYEDFTARVSGAKIVLASNDRDIPDRTFRGYEHSMVPGAAEELWPGCRVSATYAAVSGATRITISVLEVR